MSCPEYNWDIDVDELLEKTDRDVPILQRERRKRAQRAHFLSQDARSQRSADDIWLNLVAIVRNLPK
jgi:hypothetical protein